MNHLRASNVRDTVFITGDIHTSWASELVTRSTVGSPTAVEFVVPSVTSDNVNDFLGVPPGFVGPVAASLVQAANGHVKWAELEGHGYGVLEIRPDACRMEWFHVRERTDRDTTARRVKAYAVRSGVSRLVVQ